MAEFINPNGVAAHSRALTRSCAGFSVLIMSNKTEEEISERSVTNPAAGYAVVKKVKLVDDLP